MPSQARISPSSFQPHPTVWGVVAVGAGIAVLAIVQGGLKEGQFLALLVFVAFGALFPPAGIGVGLIILFAMLLRGGGVALADKAGELANRGVGSGPVTSSPISPQMPIVQIPEGYNPFPAPVVNVTYPDRGVV